MQDNYNGRPFPPMHQNSQLEESIFNGSHPDSKGSYYGSASPQMPTSLLSGSHGVGSIVGSEGAETTPLYSAPYSGVTQSPHTHGTSFISKPDAAEVPHFTLQPSKPDEHD
jgi:hypothetical protein